ncbi:hypothetical protein Slin15195_G007990 [Septoria linicola]|uniref:Uncharacterized protein n=1 Tax=Septoria linicola TaxID=215465 RepID=A0A9Q9AE73_9PEZI|nr:hypothetical protein Slin14017_G008000 [Septoria linicola]USW47480.1 hypothetical protein Slin15195_G007990 [Septoria linicola]
MSQAALQQFSYHEWPDGKAPTLRFKTQPVPTTALARQLNPRYDFPSPDVSCFSEFHGQNPAIAPRPCVWDPVFRDFFCYEPKTTCYVYAKLGRIFYDSVKKEHYLPDTQHQLTFATTYPEYRVYQSGEVMFWDPRRQDWYRYDMTARRILWRDQRYWPLPQRFSTPNIEGSSHSPVVPASAVVDNTLPKLSGTPWRSKKSREPRIVEVVPADTLISATTHGDSGLPEHEGVLEPSRASKRSHSGSKAWLVPKGVIYETPPHIRGHRHRRSRGGVYDLQDLVDKGQCSFTATADADAKWATAASKKRRYSWF